MKNIILSYCERITRQPSHYERQRVGTFDKVYAGVHKTITGHQTPSLTILIKWHIILTNELLTVDTFYRTQF